MVIFSSFYCTYNPDCSKADKMMRKIIYSFDIFRNFKSLMKVEEKHDQKLRVFDGIRVGAILWVAFGHTFMTMEVGHIENITAITDYIKDVTKVHTYGALFSVDIFFYLSGFLLCYVLMSSRNSRISWKLILHRLIRLFPAFLSAFALFYCILPMFGKGSLFYYYME